MFRISHIQEDCFIIFYENGYSDTLLGQTRNPKHSLRFLERFTSIRDLYIEGHKKDIEVISQLTTLESLTLRSVTLPDLSILKPLNRLLSLELKLGGTRDLSLLPEIGKLRYLEIWLVRSLSNLSMLSEIYSLQYLFLQALRNITKLPSFQNLSLLRRVHLETMKGLTNLDTIAQAPSLEELIILDMSQLQVDTFLPFVGHPTLKYASVYLGSIKKNEAVKKLLQLPEVKVYGIDFKFV